MSKHDKIILDTEPGIVEYKTNIEGWVGKDGNFYGNDKRRAIYANSSHIKCDKGHIHKKSWSKCPFCKELELPEKYLRFEFKEWDQKTPLCVYDTDSEYFFNVDDVEDYIIDAISEGRSEDSIRLMICEPLYLSQVDESYFEDVLPEDWELKDVNTEVADKLKDLNETISKAKPASWIQGKYRTTHKVNKNLS